MKYLLALALIAAGSTANAADLISKVSIHSVSVTLDRLTAAVEGAGAKVFARVDHAKGAESIGAPIKPAEMLMFGNPKLGTPAMMLAPTAGLDLPLRALAYEDENGNVHLVYHAPTDLAAIHGIPEEAEVLKKMAGALDKLTNAAVGE